LDLELTIKQSGIGKVFARTASLSVALALALTNHNPADRVDAINTFDAANQVTLRPVWAKAWDGKLVSTCRCIR
jgi:hypothetical protein